jgi:hypothetical protein
MDKKFNHKGAIRPLVCGEEGKKRTKKGKETKRSVVFLDLIRHKLMKESQHQAPLFALFAFAVKNSWRYVITL